MRAALPPAAHLAARATVALALLCALGAASTGCRERSLQIGSPEAPSDPRRLWVEGLRATLHEPLAQRVESQAGKEAFAALLAKEAKRPWGERVASGVKYADLFERVYAEREHRKILTSYDGLSSTGRLVLETLRGAEAHVIEEPMAYHVAAIEKLDAELKALGQGAEPQAPLVLTPPEIEALIAVAERLELSPTEPASLHALLAHLSAPLEPPQQDQEARAERLRSLVESWRARAQKSAALTARLELLVADGLLRYARDMRHFNLNRFNWQGLQRAGGSRQVIYERLEQVWRETAELAQAQTSAELVERLKRLLPDHPDYLRLKAMRERYTARLARGDWPQVEPFTLTLDASSPHAAALRARLALDGYLSAPEAPQEDQEASTTTMTTAAATTVDSALLEAARAYHEAHGWELDERGRGARAFWSAMREAPERSLARVELNMRRRRASRYRGERDFVFVNLPDYHAEVWRDGDMAMRFKVIVGKPNRVCDPETGRYIYPNATPELHSALEHFILNPSWYVPERIIEEEIKPQAEADASWMEQNHYELVRQRGSSWVVRQKPGEHNALGRVKFIFPNPHNTYMHDTAKKELFSRSRRAYSHGCMRVHEPLEFARYLIDYDGQSGSLDLDEVIASGQSKMIRMNRELPVFVEYYTIQFDAEGRARTLEDIYHKDRRALSEDPDAYDSCHTGASSAPQRAQDGETSDPR